MSGLFFDTGLFVFDGHPGAPLIEGPFAEAHVYRPRGITKGDTPTLRPKAPAKFHLAHTVTLLITSAGLRPCSSCTQILF